MNIFSGIPQSLFSVFFAGAVLHGIFLGILLWGKSRGERRSLKWLGGLLLITACWAVNYWFYLSESIRSTPHLLGLVVPPLYLAGAVLWFFARHFAGKPPAARVLLGLHFLPLLYALWRWIPLYGWSAERKAALIEAVYAGYRPELADLLLSDLPGWLLLSYAAYTLHWLRRCRRHARDAKLRWLLKVVGIVALLAGLKTIIPVIGWLASWSMVAVELSLVLLLIAVLHLIGYLALDTVSWPAESVGDVPKYRTSSLNKAQLVLHRERLVRLLEEERPWLARDFSPRQIATALDLPVHQVSQVLNEGMEAGFYEVVNRFRVQEVQRRLRRGDLERYSLAGLAAECGFGSKSSLHRAFKRETDLSPTAWLKSVSLH